ncbi:MAG: ABC transporter ATP-binding protein [Lentimicrobiaceae bacterium]|nr:ABC transporter ATP-binding protein [Lentimicrobiaceae bacterium]
MNSDSLISLRNLSKVYSVGAIKVNALKNINLDINKNEFVALMGPSGSGKSTLMNILGCLDTPTSGEYYLNKQGTHTLSDNQLAEIRNKEIGFVFQTFNLLPQYNILDNVILPQIYMGVGKEERNRRGRQVIEQVGLTDRIDHKPNEISGGQRQRVAIARALVNQPSIILADEPTGNLDSKTSVEIMRLLQDIHKMGNTIILVTHEEDIAKYSRRIIRIIDGEIESDNINSNPEK